VLLAIPLVLVVYTHLWNPVGFPTIHPDEGYYIGRSIHISEGLGPKEESARYDHPYLGWLFLGSIFNLIGYPESANPTPGDANSIATVWLSPRVTMGVLAVIDTFLIYKIAERRYNRNVALVAAILFAVMPYTWLIRRVLIEPIQLPFLLTSILFALYSGTKARKASKIEAKSEKLVHASSRRGEEDELIIRNRTATSEKAAKREGRREGYDDSNYNEYGKIMSNQNIILFLSSGIFLGLTIFAKIPAITLIPLIGFIIFTNNKKSFKALGMWIIPVILIPMIWPIHALSVGDMETWQQGVLYQTTRISKPLFDAVNDFYNKDPVLLILGTAGFAFAAITRKDFIFLIWVVPFFALFYIVNYVSHFHLIPLIPAFCIGAAVMIADISDRILKNKKLVHKILPIAVIFAIGIFGLISTSSLILKTRNSSDFDVIALASEYLPASAEVSTGSDDHVTIVGNSKQFWIFQYVFGKQEYDYKSPNNMVSKMMLENARDGSEKVLMMADENMRKIVTGEELPRTSKPEIKAERIADLYSSTETVAKTHKVEIRTNY
jgi:Dolichyl-phosphate-mannose-protein mannosyltransferase